MRLKIFHETIYQFGSDVFLEPHFLRFKPKITANNNLEFYSLDVSPNPAGLSEQRDAESNLIHFCWFNGMTDKLTIRSESIVEVHEHNPFNFFISPINYSDLPFTYSAHLHDTLQSALRVAKINDPLIEYGNGILKDSNNKTIDFLTNLTKRIHSDFVIETRLIGEPYPADKTFSLKIGSCRDVSWMQIQLLRHLGIASRFVSGYFYIDEEEMEFELHGWIEVFLPGAGWIGFDPSHGILAGSAHIPVCSGAYYESTMPVTGTTRGSAESSLHSDLTITPLN
ncbi:MAG: transglutaminase family protein [Bacteroidetes bacterium]|nr:transglutaminase family protein [Bacteroidota bacterium]MDA1120178.1 transglutaminase family protein [Bacteroidota bacterium]